MKLNLDKHIIYNQNDLKNNLKNSLISSFIEKVFNDSIS